MTEPGRLAQPPSGPARPFLPHQHRQARALRQNSRPCGTRGLALEDVFVLAMNTGLADALDCSSHLVEVIHKAHSDLPIREHRPRSLSLPPSAAPSRCPLTLILPQTLERSVYFKDPRCTCAIPISLSSKCTVRQYCTGVLGFSSQLCH